MPLSEIIEIAERTDLDEESCAKDEILRRVKMVTKESSPSALALKIDFDGEPHTKHLIAMYLVESDPFKIRPLQSLLIQHMRLHHDIPPQPQGFKRLARKKTYQKTWQSETEGSY
jgi:hypothetical protein